MEEHVIDQFILLSQTPASNSNAKVGSVTQVNANGKFLAPVAIICNPQGNPSNSGFIEKKLDSIPIKVLNTSRKRDSKSCILNPHIDSTNNLKHLQEEILGRMLSCSI